MGGEGVINMRNPTGQRGGSVRLIKPALKHCVQSCQWRSTVFKGWGGGGEMLGDWDVGRHH